MWENWEKEETSDKKIYSLPLGLEIEGTKMVIELTIMLLRSSDNPKNWEVLITTFHPSTGENIVFEDTFQSFQKAEKAAWDQAQASIKIRKKWLT
jgi:hypothetical protein